MQRSPVFQSRILLATGDSIILTLVTLLGFASHDQLGVAGLRILSTLIPLLGAWFLVSPHLLVFDVRRAANPTQLWRPFWAMVLAAPLAAWLRGIILDAPIIPIFVVIIGGVSALALLAWRVFYLLVILRKKRLNG